MPPPLLFSLDDIDLSEICLTQEQIYAEGLPQRHEFMLLDGVCHVDTEAGNLVAYADIKEDAWWVRGHIPGRPLLPGVLMLEMAGQSSALLSRAIEPRDGFIGFGGVDECKFREAVEPPSRLYILCSQSQQRSRKIVAKAQGVVNGKMAFQATITGISMG